MNALIVKTSSLGDIIQSFPVLTYLKEGMGMEVDWVVETPFAPLVKAHPHVRNVLEVDTKKWRKKPFSSETRQAFRHFRKELQSRSYDWVIDLQGNTKSGILTALARGSNKGGFGRKTVPEWPNLLVTDKHVNPPSGQNIRDDYLSLTKGLVGDKKFSQPHSVRLCINEREMGCIEGIVKGIQASRMMVCPGAQWPNKVVPHQTMQALLRNIVDTYGMHLFFTWGNASERARITDLAKSFGCDATIVDKLPLPVLQNLMAGMDLVFAMDSLPLHLCATTDTPSFSFFGPSSAKKYRPRGLTHGSVQGSCPYDITFEKRCPFLRKCDTAECINDFKPDTLFLQFKEWWESL